MKHLLPMAGIVPKSRRHWTKADDAQLRELTKDHTQEEMAKIIGRNIGAIAARSKRLEIDAYELKRLHSKKQEVILRAKVEDVLGMLNLKLKDLQVFYNSGHRDEIRITAVHNRD